MVVVMESRAQKMKIQRCLQRVLPVHQAVNRAVAAIVYYCMINDQGAQVRANQYTNIFGEELKFLGRVRSWHVPQHFFVIVLVQRVVLLVFSVLIAAPTIAHLISKEL
jgi:hypothetical protein